jgi:hypothetical protein
MADVDYTPEQVRALDEMKKALGTVLKYEELIEIKYGSQLNVDDYIKKSDADLALDHFPPFHVLEDRLRVAITKARRAGLGEDSLVRKVGKIAFDES